MLALLRLGLGVPVILADALAIASSAVVSYFANRALTFTRDPHLRWVDEPFAYGVVTALAGVVDVLVVRTGLALFDETSARVLLVSKTVALAIAGGVRLIGYRSVLFRQVRAAQDHPVARRDPAPGERRFSVVIPGYNAADEIATTVQRLVAEVGGVIGRDQLEIIVVDDGSRDGTAEVAEAAGADLVMRQVVNRGKGAAVRAGMLGSHGRAVAFTDADLAYEPALLLDVLYRVEAGWDVVVGSRAHIETVTLVRARRLRSLGSRVINLISFAVLLGAYRDTQCGLKAFRSDAAQSIFSVARIDRFAFDIEVFHLVERQRLALLEVPVTLRNTETTTVRAGFDSLQVIVDMFRIRRFAGEGLYDHTN